MTWLKQSTIVTVQLGAFLDFTDGVTPEVGLATAMDNATTGIRVSKNGAAMIDRNSATVPAHDDDGHYRIALSATDTNTLGTLRIQFEQSTVTTPAWRDFMVVPANVWDSFFGTDELEVDMIRHAGGLASASSGNLDVNVETADAAVNIDANVTQWNGAAVAVPTVTGVPEVDITHCVGGLASASAGELDVDVESWNATAVTSDLAGRPNVNVQAISQDNVAADNLEADYDGTGFTRAASTIGTTTTNTDMLTTAEVLTQVNTALDAAISELTQAAPSSTPSLRNAAMLLYMALRNRLDVDTSGADELQIHNNANVVIAKKALTDTAGDYSEAQMVTGP